MQEPRILTQNLGKHFLDPQRGEVAALHGVNLDLGPGVVALLGANGAGKTTLLRLMLGLLRQDQGTISVCGLEPHPHGTQLRKRMGYLSLSTRSYARLTVSEMLTLSGMAMGLDAQQCPAQVQITLAQHDLAPLAHSRIASLSTGQAQRVGLARVLLTQPEVLILDEPTTGLDLVAAEAVLEVVEQRKQAGGLIIMCTHLLHEAARLADRVVVLQQGTVAWDGPCAELGTGDHFAQAVRTLVGQP